MRKVLLAAALLAAFPLGGRAATADACTWGGTAAAPTGTFTIGAPGLSSLHGSPPGMGFSATGALAGPGARCTGWLTISGVFLPGSMCRLCRLTGDVEGVPGVSAFNDTGGAYSVAEFYAPDGTLVGSYGASVIHQGFLDAVQACAGSGFRGGNFYATAEFAL